MVPALPTTGSTMTQAISSGRAAKTALYRIQVVVGEREGVHRGLGRDACGAGDAERRYAAAGLDQHGVGVAVVAALELDDEVSACESASETDRRHAGLGAGADEAKLFDRREAACDQFGEVSLGRDGGSEACALGCGLLDGFDDGRKGVAEDHGAPGAKEVEVTVAVFVEEIGAFGVREEGRVAAYGAEGSDGRVDASGKEFFGALLQVTGAGEGCEACFQYRRSGRLANWWFPRPLGPLRIVAIFSTMQASRGDSESEICQTRSDT